MKGLWQTLPSEPAASRFAGLATFQAVQIGG
jgi:hypothetical protein